MFDSVQPHRRQPTRLLCPWDSPGKNTGVGCHFLLQCMKVKSESEDAQSEPPGKPMNTGVGSLSLLQGIFPTQKSNQGLLHCRRILSQLSSQGSPKLLLIQYKYFYNLFSDIVLRVIHFDTYSSCSFIFAGFIVFIWGSLVVQIVKNPPVVQYSD